MNIKGRIIRFLGLGKRKINYYKKKRIKSAEKGKEVFEQNPIPVPVPVLEADKIFEDNQEFEEPDDNLVTLPNLQNVSGKLVLKVPQGIKTKYIVLESKSTVKNPIVANTINIDINDIIFILTYNNEQLCINIYRIVDTKEINNAIIVDEKTLTHINEIDKYEHIPNSVKIKIKNYFYLVGKPEQLI